jgi:hypothetical protein
MSDAPDEPIPYEELRAFEPFDWPGRVLVEQDNTGDWGGWLSQFDGWLQDVLQDPGADVAPLAESIAMAYIAECRTALYPLPADFDATGDTEAAQAADKVDITQEFIVYLRTWQAAIAASL